MEILILHGRKTLDLCYFKEIQGNFEENDKETRESWSLKENSKTT